MLQALMIVLTLLSPVLAFQPCAIGNCSKGFDSSDETSLLQLQSAVTRGTVKTAPSDACSYEESDILGETSVWLRSALEYLGHGAAEQTEGLFTSHVEQAQGTKDQAQLLVDLWNRGDEKCPQFASVEARRWETFRPKFAKLNMNLEPLDAKIQEKLDLCRVKTPFPPNSVSKAISQKLQDDPLFNAWATEKMGTEVFGSVADIESFLVQWNFGNEQAQEGRRHVQKLYDLLAVLQYLHDMHYSDAHTMNSMASRFTMVVGTWNMDEAFQKASKGDMLTKNLNKGMSGYELLKRQFNVFTTNLEFMIEEVDEINFMPIFVCGAAPRDLDDVCSKNVPYKPGGKPDQCKMIPFDAAGVKCDSFWYLSSVTFQDAGKPVACRQRTHGKNPPCSNPYFPKNGCPALPDGREREYFQSD